MDSYLLSSSQGLKRNARVESFRNDVQDGLVVELAVVGCGDVNQVLEPLEGIVVGHTCLPEVI